MEYVQINNIQNPLFRQLHNLMKEIFPAEEVLAFELWKEPLEDPSIRVFVAVHKEEVVGATEYRYYPNMNVAMTDFTIIKREGLGIGRFLAANREADLKQLADQSGTQILGMFAEIYDPYRAKDYSFGGNKVMDPFVRREVLSHLGYRRLNFPYVHPSWENNGEAVQQLDLCFLPYKEINGLEGKFIAQFLQIYYQVLSNKPEKWLQMIKQLNETAEISLVEL
ncbi:GNAT family N-acetyltransferase [Caldibacillus lycopersici]|uniref:GNAT family N-acetyltransferase n=1 Tax=Perspicuibacillus lycopersici TaxID=1325689 RepID=A0AAE3LLI6_9BACI|nr:GNAT family N-acetyltransferase [Perspicuibacillus lycopersici]MCU9612385.1 GNAT family N-acetyltransferase [Perspicuibacillus lycopersici]